jgi:diguanylate cyclase (GGDEF)-like protein
MGIRLTARQPLFGYVAVTALLAAVHYARPAAWTAGVMDLLAAAAVLAGTLVNRPARRLPWVLLAIANLAVLSGGEAGAVSALKFPLIIAALLIFIDRRAVGRDLRGAADALIPAVGLALLAWFLLITPDAPYPPLTWQLRLLAVAYLAGDLLVVVTLARLLAPGTLRGLSAALLTLGTLGRVASDAAYVALNLVGDASARPAGAVLDAGWLICYFTWGVAALHPSMTELTRPARPRELNADTPSASMVILRVASLAAPLALFAQAWLHHDGVEGWAAVAVAVLYGMMISRLWAVAASYRRSLVRERTLRVAGASLASARSVEDVAAAVRAAAATLVPAVPRQRAALLAVRDGDYLLRVEPGAAPDAMPRDPIGTWLGLASQPKPRFVSLAEFPGHGGATGDGSGDSTGGTAGGAPLVSAPPPGPPARESYEGAMMFPLNLKDRPDGDPFIGLLAFFGSRPGLTDASAALEILAGQAALAVERVVLSREVVRQRGEALFRTLVHDTSDVILVLGDDRRIRFATPSAADFFGDVTVAGRRLTDLVGPDGREDVDRVIDLMLTLSGANGGGGEGGSEAAGGGAEAAERAEETRGGEDAERADGAEGGAYGGRAEEPGYLLRVERLDGRFAVLEVRWSDLRRDPTVGGLVLTLRDVTEQHELEQELKYQAFHDALTGLPNRLAFAQEAADALEESRRTGRTTGVLFVDIDDFKVVNDTMGHSLGDELLVGVAGRLAAAIRQTDMAARLGGDEFALLIEDAADVAAVESFAERIVRGFTEPFALTEAAVLASVTVGVATSQDSADVGELLRHADLALYAAKGAGKRRWRRYHEALSSGMLRRREIVAALEAAVRTSAFTLAYQPIVSLESGEIAGFESLIRWPHPRWGVMLPGQFIEIAEETGHIVPIGAWVLRQALADLGRWQGRLPRPQREPGPPGPPGQTPLHVSVNVSARQFRDPGFVDSVRRALRASRLAPEALLLELTESILFTDNERSREELAELKEIGVRLAVDDFGTGYSSLSYLLDLPIDVLKIDKTFVTGIATSWRRYALVEGIIRLARTLQVEVIAEGIETQSERELLVGMGCEFGQGYLLSVPVNADQAEAMLRLGHGLVHQLPRPRPEPPADRYVTDL